MRSAFYTVYQSYGRLLTVIAMIAGAALFAIMCLADANVVGRKLFNAPITGTLELTEAAMPLVILLPLAFTQYRRGHIRVLLLIRHLPHATQRWLTAVTLAIGCGFMIWVTSATWDAAAQSYSIGESAWGSVRFPIWPSKIGIVIGAALVAFQFFLDFIRVVVFDEDSELANGASHE